MRGEADSLRDQGRWRGGHRTLMHALGIQHREVFLTAGLAWLLDPDGWHGLGSRVLSSAACSGSSGCRRRSAIR